MGVVGNMVAILEQAEKGLGDAGATHATPIHVLITGMDDLPRLRIDNEKGTNALGSK